MSCWVLIPLKNTCAGKSRLVPSFSALQRQHLINHMLKRVLTAARRCELVDGIALVGRELPPQAGLLCLSDAGNGLNPALEDARATLRQRGASELVVVHADLPQLRSADLAALIVAGRQHQLAMASDRHVQGTNALYLSTRLPFAFQFGAGSLQRHQVAARQLQITPALLRRPGLAVDIDTIDDLRHLEAVANPSSSTPRSPATYWSQSPWQLSTRY